MINLFKRNARTSSMMAMLAVATPLTAQYEGLRLRAYLDPVGIPTICYGETENVALGDIKTKRECDNILALRLAYFGQVVQYNVTQPISPKTHAAFSSLAYNIGTDKFQKSTLLKLFNAGKAIQACDEMRKWVYAGGKKLNGLVKRREAERKLCLEGLND